MNPRVALRFGLALLLTGAAQAFADGFQRAFGPGDGPARAWETLELTVTGVECSGNPFDVRATATFRHAASGERRTTEFFHIGAQGWSLRFTPTRPGTWTYETSSSVAALGAFSGSLDIAPNPGARGFMKAIGNKWAWQGTDEAFVPQYVMGKHPEAYYDFEAGRVRMGKIDRDIDEFVDAHGFTGFHIQVRGNWFEIRGAFAEPLNPDPRTYEVLETVIQRVHARGGACHLWMWGKDTRDGDGPRQIVGAPMNEADQRNLRYLAARLGPVPGWSIGYGYDTENLWASPEELDAWKKYIEDHAGWDHFIGARVGFDEKGLYGEFGRGIPKPPLDEKFNAPIGDEYTAWLGGDYIGYTSYRPLYERYVAVIDHQPSKPSFDEDRFRIRDAAQWLHKDYDAELTLKGLWHSAMAAGVANIWGHLLPDEDEGGSQPYAHGRADIKPLIKTYATFFRDKARFRADFVRDSALADPYAGTTERHEPANIADISACLRSPGHAHYVFYKENTDSVGMDLSGMQGAQQAVAVDAKKPYAEIAIGSLEPGKHTWRAPYASDWAIAVGDF